MKTTQTKIKLCGLSRITDIEAVNELKPEYIGFVFWKKSKRYVEPDLARRLKELLDPSITAVGVFIDEELEQVVWLLQEGIIDVAQLHGSEDSIYIRKIKEETGKPVIRAFKLKKPEDAAAVNSCNADYVLLDSGAGTGKPFDWNLIQNIQRPYFLAGGLSIDNVAEAIELLHPYAVDISSGIETDGKKDTNKMTAFVAAVRKEDRI